MKLLTVAEALSAEVDESILAIRGKLIKLWKQVSGEGEYGTWTLQSGTLKDDSGEIKINFSNREDVPQNWRGQVIEMRCTKGQKGGFSGVKRSLDNRKADILHVTASADVFLFKAEHKPEPDDARPDGQDKGPGKTQDGSAPTPKGDTAPRTQSGPKEQPSEVEQMAEGGAIFHQIANAQYAAVVVVHEYLIPLLKARGIQIDPEAESALIQNMLIQGYRDHRVQRLFPSRRFPINKPNGKPPTTE